MTSILPIPDIFQARKILAIQPHYDDNDIGAGGTLSRLHEKGAEIIYLTVTDDLMGVLDASLSPEAASAQLRCEQAEAGAFIGVSQHFWLGYPDAGSYDYYELRRKIIQAIRQFSPDFLFAPDPWLPYEAHRDHIQTGLAAAEAAMLYGLPRLPSDPVVDAAYAHHDILGVAFYYTADPNVTMDVGEALEKKVQAVRCYRAQFSPGDMEMLVQVLDAKGRMFAAGQDFSHAETFKVMHPMALHCGV